ncbi:PepSY-associated TM helix domain-containing protein [Altericroceibacterium spongiae]|nr:PepSY-associated TM helix domain-containing protein [Altericroceibacterium spongiae]
MTPPSRRGTKKPRRQNGRRLWVTVHRWLGLCLAILLVPIALTGAVLALKSPLLRWEMGPEPFRIPAVQSAPLSSDQLQLAAQQSFPQISHIMGMAEPHEGFFDSPNITAFGMIAGRQRAMGVGFLDPATGEARGFYIYDDLWIAKAVNLHRSLFLPSFIGGPLLALIGLGLTVSTVTGLWLWWPRRGRWKAQLFPASLRKGKMRLLEWHRWAGAWLSVPILCLALSGIWLSIPRLWAILPGLDRASGQRVRSVIADLHDNLLLGELGSALTALSGIVLAILVVTGVWAWWRRTRR